MLHSRVLRYLDEVARAGSIRAAAERLNVASSAVNKHVLALEAALGQPLFDRLPRGLRLTPTGELILAHVRQTLKDFKEVEASIRDLRGLEAGEVTIATMSGLAGGIIPQVAAPFQARHPRIRVSVRVMFIRDIIEAVTTGEADIGFAYNLPADPQLEFIEDLDARLGVIVSPGHPLARMGSVPLGHCTGYPLIFADRALLLHDAVAGAFAAEGLSAEPAFRTNSIEAMKVLAGSGAGIAFLSRFDIAEEYRWGALTYVPVRGNALGRNRLALVQRDRRSLGPAASILLDDLRTALRNARS